MYWECETPLEAVEKYAAEPEKATQAMKALAAASQGLGTIQSDDALLVHAVLIEAVAEQVREAIYSDAPEQVRERIDQINDAAMVRACELLAPILQATGHEVVVRILAEVMICFITAHADGRRLACAGDSYGEA